MRFTDINEEHWAYEAIQHGIENKYTNGYEDGSFRPNGDITRAEFCAIVARRDPEFDRNTLYYTQFADCTGYEWFTSYISFCYQRGYITAYSTGEGKSKEFRPNQAITREEAAVALASTIKEV